MIGMWLMYGANIIIAGWISWSCLFFPEKAVHTVFTGTLVYSEAIRLVGALWGGIFILSILGLFLPLRMSPILLFQLIYKGSWLIGVAWPAIRNQAPYPKSMAIFFLIWVVVLPFIIPWRYLLGTI